MLPSIWCNWIDPDWITCIVCLYSVGSWKQNVQQNLLRPNRIVSCHFILHRNAQALSSRCFSIYFFSSIQQIHKISCRGFVSFIRLNTPIHSLIHPSIHAQLTNTSTRTSPLSPTRLNVFFLFFFFHYGFVFVQLFTELQHDHTEKWWVHLRPNKKKCLQSVVAVVANGSYV